MKKIFFIGTILILAFSFLIACNNKVISRPSEDAYLELFKHLLGDFTNEWVLQQKYIAIDLTNVLYEHPDRIQKVIEDHMENYHFMIIWDDMSGLIESGYITVCEYGDPESFVDGFLVTFNDVELNKNDLITNASVWYGNLGASGAKYTVSNVRGEWIVKEPETVWV